MTAFYEKCGNLEYMRFIIVIILLIFSSGSSFASPVPGKSKAETESSRSKGKIKSKKSLLSFFFLLNLFPAKRGSPSGSIFTVPDLKGSGTGYGKNSYPFPFLKSPEKKKEAVEALYKKYGFNKVVKWKLDEFITHKQSFRKRLSRSGKYIGAMAGIFAKKGLPVELVYLPLIESKFDPFAYSRSKASGPWQLMPLTAKRLDLKIDWWVDERRDPIKSTNAAAQYLHYLHNRFGSWTLALAAYNGGEGRIGKALRVVGKKDFWKIRRTPYIARETKNYVPLYIAATAIAMDPESFGFKSIEYHKPLTYDEVVIQDPMDLELVAKFTDVKTIDIKELNPELRRLCTPPNVSYYTLRIPKGTKRMFLKKLAGTKGNAPYYVNLYTIRSGDTVEKIADKLGSSIQKIITLNGLGKKALIMAGKSILVPLEKNWERMFGTSGL